MARLYEYVMRSRGLSRETFQTEFPHPFLVVQHVDDAPKSQWSFKTQTLSTTGIEFVEMLEREGLTIAPEAARYEVFPVAKQPGNPWPERISVGRARNSDIVLSDNSVSKLHAHFIVNDSGHMTVVDAGSRNGVRLGKKKLNASEPEKVRSGDTITFGAAALTFLGPAELFDLIGELLSSDTATG
ncbi:MAG: FHA domain-containing protein [Myxococcota bacterium]